VVQAAEGLTSDVPKPAGGLYPGRMDTERTVTRILRADPVRWRMLEVVAALELPDCWIAAGFVRNAVWDHLHRRLAGPLTGDVDVIWHDPSRSGAKEDRELEAVLRAADPSIDWSVKNQARMHLRNGDRPYASSADAMRCWPETATAVAARRIGADECEISAPLGLDDLFALLLRPGPRFHAAKHNVFAERIAAKAWLSRWPKLRIVEPEISDL
jgi:Uncharacterized protein conserved in bacteria